MNREIWNSIRIIANIVLFYYAYQLGKNGFFATGSERIIMICSSALFLIGGCLGVLKIIKEFCIKKDNKKTK